MILIIVYCLLYVQSLAVVAMAVEEDVTVVSNTHHSLNDVTQQSTEDSDIQTDPQQTESNNLEQGDSNTELSKDVVENTATGSHEQQVGMVDNTRAKSSHTPTFCKSSNYLRDIITKLTESGSPVCNMEPRLRHVDPGLEFVDQVPDTTSTGEFGEDTKQDG